MKRSEKNTLQHPGPAYAMATPWPRETFVIPGDAGQAARTINMIKIDDAFRTQLLTIFNGATSEQGPNTMPAIGPMGHTQGHVDFPINSINVGNHDNPNFVRFDDYNVRTSHVKTLCALRGGFGTSHSDRSEKPE